MGGSHVQESFLNKRKKASPATRLERSQGISGRTLDKIAEVCEAAEAEPDRSKASTGYSTLTRRGSIPTSSWKGTAPPITTTPPALRPSPP